MFDNIYNGKKVVITGNTGFKGSWLTVWLLKLGAKVIGISKDIPTNPSMFEALQLESKITYFKEDLRNYQAVKKIISTIKPDFIFHLAAQPLVVASYLIPLETITTNVVGTANILESLRELNPFCIAVIITSDKCYDNVEWVWGYKETDTLGGKDIYSGSKGAAELIIKSYYHSFFKDPSRSNVKLISTRAGNVIGGGDWADYRIVPDCIRAWRNGDSVEIRSPKATRPWQHVLEPLCGYLAIATELSKNAKLNGENFNFGPHTEHTKTVYDLLNDLSKYWNLKQEPSRFSENLSEFHEAGLLKLNCDKALFHLNWLPAMDYHKLIEFTSTWYYSFYYDKNIDLFKFTLNQINEYEKIAKEKNIAWAITK